MALPRPPQIEAATRAMFEATSSPGCEFDGLCERRYALAFELELVDAQLERAARESLCGATDDTQDVELYDGGLGVPKSFVEEHEKPIGQLQWLPDLAARFSGPGESPGNVSGQRWGSGGLIEPDLYLTAAHCFAQSGGGWRRPRRGGRVISPEEIATLMQVNFDYQVDGATGTTKPGRSFPIVELVEYGPNRGGLDYALVRVGADPQGRLPGSYGTLEVALSDLRTPGAMLCMIQHPSGRPKRIEAGPLHSNIGSRIAYDSLDTEGGSSGSPILDGDTGRVVGVHTNGGCGAFSGFNYGVSIGAIRAASSKL